MKKILASTNNLLMVYSNNHFLSAFFSGLLGFLLFFLIIMIVKTISYWLGTISQIRIQPEDIMLSFIGLILMALIRVLEDLRLKGPMS